VSNPGSWPIVEVCDPSGRRGLHIIWATVDPDDYWYIVWAAKVPPGAFSEMAKTVKAERRMLPHEPDLAIMDARGGAFQVDMETRETFFDRFRQFGLMYTPSIQQSETLDADIAILRDWLAPKYNPVKDAAVPKLRFTRAVANMKEGPLWAIQSFIWDPHSQTKAWHYKQKSKDFVDCLRYLAIYPGLTYRRFQHANTMVDPRNLPGLAGSYRRPKLSGDARARSRNLIVKAPASYRAALNLRSRKRGLSF
jgi:hypothetical protein